MPGHIYVDETKRRDYLLVAGVVLTPDQRSVRQLVQGLVLPGQRRLHMKNENDSRRRSIATAIAASGVQATIYDAGRRYRTDLAARGACLRALVEDAAASGHELLVLEQDDTLIQFDRRTLYAAARAAGCSDTLRYEHRRASAEALLAIPDAIAWCWAKGGDWRRRIEPVVVDVRTL